MTAGIAAEGNEAPKPLSPESSAFDLTIAGLAAVLDPVPGAWFIARQNMSFAYVSTGACEWLGYGRDDLMSKSILDIDPTLDAQKWQQMWASTSPPDTMTVQTQHQRKNGTRFPVEVRAVRLILGGEDFAVSYAVDQTQSEETRAALRDSEAQLQRLLEHLPDMVFRVRLDSPACFSFVSSSCERLLGYSPQEMSNAPGGIADFLEPEDVDKFAVSALQSDGVAAGVKFRHRDGRRVWMDLRATARTAEGAGIATVEGVARDVTEPRRLQGQLLQAQKMEAVGQLAGGVAHDFNNLLQIVQGNGRLIQQQVKDGEVLALVGEVLDATERASSLVRQLLTFSRRGVVEFSPVDVTGCVWSMRDMLQRAMGSDVVVHWQCDAFSSVVMGNAAQIEQVLVNLCVNARDAMSQGGNLYVSLGQASESATSTGDPAHAGCLQLTVRDDGEGMEPDVLSRLYEPFFTTKSPGKGTGLGLSTVYAVVHEHGGTIEVESMRHRGTTFRVFLPLVSNAVPPRVNLVRQVTVRGSGRVVLIAEDEPAVLTLTSDFLRSSGFEVLEALNGKDARRLLLEHQGQVELAILDVLMPDVGGLELFQQLRCEGHNLPVVFVTGFDRDALAQVIHEPAVGVVTKPFTREQLLARVAELLPDTTSDKALS